MNLAYLIAPVIILLVVGLVVLLNRLPYRFEHQGKRYYRLRDGSFTDAAKVKVNDASLLPALAASYKKAREAQDARADWNAPDMDYSSSSSD